MVFLRLTVKVCPAPPSSRSSQLNHLRSPVSFLLVLNRPQEVTLHKLASMIQEKWIKLRPTCGYVYILDPMFIIY